MYFILDQSPHGALLATPALVVPQGPHGGHGRPPHQGCVLAHYVGRARAREDVQGYALARGVKGEGGGGLQGHA